ncbi:MAG: capsular polysaccharide biosynthesis protein [Pasteurella sp.]|nr:capsular polysaccharide biosynthesis protein [Pasteurella sp.]
MFRKKNKIEFLQDRFLLRNEGTFLVGWGRKKSGWKAIEESQKLHKSFILLEDGFVRSISRLDQELSIVSDNKGIFYDASVESELEILIKQEVDYKKIIRVRELIKLWQKNNVSKYNSQNEYSEKLPENYILVIDQVLNDESIKYGLASKESFDLMLKTALAENPHDQVVLKLHPDVFTRSAVSHFDLQEIQNNKRITIIAENCHPVRLMKYAKAVYVVTSQVGFEALLWGKKVHTFGMPFYAGYGLTADFCSSPKRRINVSLEQLVYAALISYPKYLNPVTEELCDVEQVIKYVGCQREKRLEFPSKLLAVGFSRWKKAFLIDFLQGSKVTFRKNKPFLNSSDSYFVVWGAKFYEQLKDNHKVIRVEDGFLRSSGLGADLLRPISLVFDDVGIYFDATRPSKLENILNKQNLQNSEMLRARKLIKLIVDSNLTKYNVGSTGWEKPDTDQKIILVVGQVESDASIKYGSPIIKTNIDLLRKVRSLEPDSYIIFKPHPDVLAKLRKEGQEKELITDFCDEVLGNVAATQIFDKIDVLHTMTSLMGFEALIRDVPVVCHGLPFYAGWGLTQDLLSCKRRAKKLSIEELVYGTLVSYPRYVHYEKPIFIEPEDAISQLQQLVKNNDNKITACRKIIRYFMRFFKWLRKNN